MVVANQLANHLAIYLSNGNDTFQTPRKCFTGVGSSPYMVVVGDFNNDHQIDIAVANFDANSIGVFIGHGNGSFENQIVISTGSSRPRWINIVHLNNDTRLDIITANHGTQSISVLYGHGNGSFSDPIMYSTGYSPESVAVGDFNNDNRLDIVVANRDSNNVGILIGYVDQAVEYKMSLITGNGSRSQSFVINDFNNDHRMDIAVANSGSNSIGIFLGYNNYSFTNQTTYDTGFSSSPRSIAVGNFNEDNHLDIVVANYGNDSIIVLFGDGNGSFPSRKTFTTGLQSQPYSIVVGDFNNDALADIIVANYGTNEVGVFISYGNGTFADMRVLLTDYGSRPFFVVVGDFNNDRKLDFAVANEGTDNLKIFLQTC